MASNQLSKNIARCRKQIGMTQEDLGQALFVSGQAVSRWERGGTPDAELLQNILYSGVWTRFEAAFRPQQEEQA